MNFRYPIFLDLAGKKCLVTGEGYELASKVKGLVDASANVIYVNPSAEPPIQELATAGLIRWEARDFRPGDLDDCFLVITDRDENAEVFRLAEERRILCNAVDDPRNCRFSFGSIYRQGDLSIAISTNGWAPALAVRLKEFLQRNVGPEYGELLELLKEVRSEITTRIPDFSARRDLWYRIVDSDVLAKLRDRERDRAVATIRQMIEETAQRPGSSE